MADVEIVIVSRNGASTKGGVERVVGMLLAELNRKKINTEIFSQDKLPTWMRWRENFVTFSLATSLILSFRRYVLRSKFLVISNSYFTPFFCADITIAHGSAIGYLKAAAEPGGLHLGLRGLALLEQLTLRNSNRIICVSDAVRNAAISFYGVDPNRCEVIYNGVEIPDKDLPAKFSGPAYKFGYAGRMEYGKGLEYFNSLSDLISKNKEFELHLAIIGDINPMLIGLDNVYVYNDVPADKMSDFYDKIDIFLLPSKFEGFELVTLEALANGVCVLGFPVGACGVLIEKGVPWAKKLPVEPESLVKYGREYVEDFRQVWNPILMRRFISQNFDIRRFVSKLMAMLEAPKS